MNPQKNSGAAPAGKSRERISQAVNTAANASSSATGGAGARSAEKAAREALFYLVFESLFSPESAEQIIENAYTADNFDIDEALEARFLSLTESTPEIDALITRHSQKREFSRLPKVSAAILRVAFFEILKTGLHPNIAAAEAVRFATDFADTQDVKFINGVLGEYLRNGS